MKKVEYDRAMEDVSVWERERGWKEKLPEDMKVCGRYEMLLIMI